MTWMQTASGKAISFLAPDPSQIDISDICLHLSRLPRFTGATRFPYSVAQHSVHVEQIVRDASPSDVAAHLWALAHDFHEFATSDVSSPLQRAIDHEIPNGWPNPLKRIQARLDVAICEAFAIDVRDVAAVEPLVKRADLIALATEKAQLMQPEPHPWIEMPPSDPIELLQISAANAEWLLRSRFEAALKAYRASKAAQIAAE